TGARGFVGRALVPLLAARHYVVAAGRGEAPPGLARGVEWRVVGEIGPETDWRAALAGVDCVIHLAAHVHIGGTGAAPEIFDRVNHRGTLRLAEAAREAGAG